MCADQDILDCNIVPRRLHTSLISAQRATLFGELQRGTPLELVLTVGFRNSFTKSFPWGLVGRSKKARLGPFSAMMASFSWTINVEKSIGILNRKQNYEQFASKLCRVGKMNVFSSITAFGDRSSIELLVSA